MSHAPFLVHNSALGSPFKCITIVRKKAFTVYLKAYNKKHEQANRQIKVLRPEEKKKA